MPHTTYTVLITLAHDPGAALSPDLLATMVERGLEEGVRGFAGVNAAVASVFTGAHIGAHGDTSMLLALRLHAAIRKPDSPGVKFTHTHVPTGFPCAIVSTLGGDRAQVNMGDRSHPFPHVALSDLVPL